MSDLVATGALALLAGILLAMLEGVRRRNVPAMVNALASLGAALSPAVVELFFRSTDGASVAFSPELTLWLATAGFLHTLGMLGPYDTVWWWDHLTHTVSAALVAALVYAGVVVVATHPSGIDLPATAIGGVTVVLTLALGVCWELIELVARDAGERLDIRPVLVHYGWRDTALDLVFDLLGALVVLLFDLRLFVPAARPFPRATRTLLTATVVVVLVGSVAMGLYLVVVARGRPTVS
jgi:hypothetical protein